MHKVEALEKKIDFLIQEFRGYFLILLALLSGEAGLFYAVVSGDKPIYVLILGAVGIFFTVIIFARLESIKSNIARCIKELEEA